MPFIIPPFSSVTSISPNAPALLPTRSFLSVFVPSMPITLTALTNLMPQQKGMAFGLLTFMLFLGSVPCLFGHKYPFFSPIGLSVLVLLSAVVLFCGLIQLEKD